MNETKQNPNDAYCIGWNWPIKLFISNRICSTTSDNRRNFVNRHLVSHGQTTAHRTSWTICIAGTISFRYGIERNKVKGVVHYGTDNEQCWFVQSWPGVENDSISSGFEVPARQHCCTCQGNTNRAQYRHNLDERPLSPTTWQVVHCSNRKVSSLANDARQNTPTRSFLRTYSCKSTRGEIESWASNSLSFNNVRILFLQRTSYRALVLNKSCDKTVTTFAGLPTTTGLYSRFSRRSPLEVAFWEWYYPQWSTAELALAADERYD